MVEDVVARQDLVVSRTLLSEYRAVPGEPLARRKITVAQWQALVAAAGAHPKGDRY